MFYYGTVGLPRHFFGLIKTVPVRGEETFTRWLTETLASSLEQTVVCFPFLVVDELVHMKQAARLCRWYVMVSYSSSPFVATTSSNTL
jgi:hypothetical protein